MTNAKFRVKNGLIVDEVSSNTGNFTILDGTVTSDAGITLATGSDGNIALSPDAGGKVTIDEPFQVSPAGAVYVDLDATAQGSNSTTLVGDAGNFDTFPASGSVYIETTTSGENPYAYTGKSATGHQLTGLSGLDSISAANVMVTLAPEAVDINGKAAVTSQTGQFPADGGQITIDGGKWGNAANDWATGINYGAVVLNQAISAVKVKASDTDSSFVYKDGTHVAEYIPILKVGSDSPNALTEETDWFSARYGQAAGGSANARSETIFFNHVNHVDTVSLMKIKSSVANTGDQDYADVLGSALVIETATGGEMNQIVFNHEPTNATRWLGAGSASLGTSDFAYAVGSVFAASGGTSTNFGMGYRGISFNTTGADAAGGFFAGSSSTYGGAGNPLASGNTFFQASTSGLVGIGPGQAPAANTTLTVGSSGEDNSGAVGGTIALDTGTAPSSVSGKLYNSGGSLYWGSTDLSASSASALNDLSDVSYSGGDLTITALDTLTFTAANDTAATIVMKADNSDDNGDDWTITANTGQTFTIGNDLSGSTVTHFTITPHATAASSSVTLPGNLIMGGTHQINNATASSATQGGKLSLISDDGAALGDDHRLGVVEFAAAEDSSSSLIYGAKIQAMADAAWSASENGTRLEFYTADGNNSLGLALTIDSDKLATFAGDVTISGNDLTFGNGATIVNTSSSLLTVTEATTQFSGIIKAHNTTTSSATEGGKLQLSADDGAVMADNHRLGVIEFLGAEDTSNTLTIGARIQAIADAAWSASENGASLEFYTTDGDASESVALTLDSNNLATFAGAVSVNGNLTVGGTTTTVNSTVTTLDDPIITLGGDTAPGSDDDKDRGVEFRYHDGSNAAIGFFGWDDSATGFTALSAATNSSEVFSGTLMPVVFGAGTFSGHVLPGADDTYDLGSATAAWQDLFLEGDLTMTDAGTIQTSAGALTLLSAAGASFTTTDGSLTLDGNDGVTIQTDGTGDVEIKPGGDIVLNPADGRDVLFQEADATYFSLGQGSVDVANIADSSGATTIDTFDCTTYQATKYLILVEDDAPDYMTCEILLLGDDAPGTAVGYLTQYGVVYNNGELGTFAATGSGDNISLTYDPADTTGSNHQVRVVAQRIASLS